MICFTPEVENEEELIELLEQGRWDREIYMYLIEIMSDVDNKVLSCDPTELFEMQPFIKSRNERLYFAFWNKEESGVCKNWRFIMNKKEEEFFNLFVIRIREIYESLKKLVI